MHFNQLRVEFQIEQKHLLREMNIKKLGRCWESISIRRRRNCLSIYLCCVCVCFMFFVRVSRKTLFPSSARHNFKKILPRTQPNINRRRLSCQSASRAPSLPVTSLFCPPEEWWPNIFILLSAAGVHRSPALSSRIPMKTINHPERTGPEDDWEISDGVEALPAGPRSRPPWIWMLTAKTSWGNAPRRSPATASGLNISAIRGEFQFRRWITFLPPSCDVVIPRCSPDVLFRARKFCSVVISTPVSPSVVMTFPQFRHINWFRAELGKLRGWSERGGSAEI